jgi:hypothetical protein
MDLLTRDCTWVDRIEPTTTEPPFRRRDVGVGRKATYLTWAVTSDQAKPRQGIIAAS